MEIPAMKIKSIYFRCQRQVRSSGGNIDIVFGENSYKLGDKVNEGFITDISISNISLGNTPFAEIYVNGNLWCNIHEHSITRIFYDMTA